MKYTIFVAAVAILTGVGVFVGNRFFSKDQYARMFVTFGPNNMPSIEVNIQGKAYPVFVNLTAVVPLTLSKDILATIEKKPHETMQFMNEKGKTVEFPTFIISKINIGDLTFTDVIVAESNGQCLDGYRVGEIGRPLLEKNNLMLDFPNSTVIACNSFDKLKRIGYRLEDMTQVPFEMEEQAGGIALPVLSDLGTIKLALFTGSAFSFIRSSFLKETETEKDSFGAYFTSSNFTMGGKNWGRQRLHLCDLPIELQEFNGGIGMDFLSEHIVYIDFKKNVAYIRKEV
jgi:hypothetical protein